MTDTILFNGRITTLDPSNPTATAVAIDKGLFVAVYRWLGALGLGGFTLIATFVANRFWEIPQPDRFMVENAFFEHLGLVGAFLLVAWYDLRQHVSGLIGEQHGRAATHR